MDEIANNFIIANGNSLGAIDNDDGSSCEASLSLSLLSLPSFSSGGQEMIDQSRTLTPELP